MCSVVHNIQNEGVLLHVFILMPSLLWIIMLSQKLCSIRVSLVFEQFLYLSLMFMLFIFMEHECSVSSMFSGVC